MTGVQYPGEFAVRGGIVDVFPPDAEDPVRIEFFGDEIESLRQFDAESQRTVEKHEHVDLAIVAPAGKDETASDGESLFDFLPESTWVALSELSDIRSEGRQYLERLKDPRGLFSVEAALSRCMQLPTVEVAPITADGFDTPCHLQIESVERFTGPRTEVLTELSEAVGRDERVLIACHNEGERERLGELLRESETNLAERVDLCLGTWLTVSAWFRRAWSSSAITSCSAARKSAVCRKSGATKAARSTASSS